jgi:flagellar biosynthetic protein FliR
MDLSGLPSVASFGLCLARVSGALVLLPLFGEGGIARAAIVPLALLASFAIAASGPDIPLRSSGVLAAATAGELALGLLMGFMVRLALLPVEVAADVFAHESGLGLASAIDPFFATPTSALQALLRALGVLFFVALGGAETTLRLLGRSFALVPAGTAGGIALRPGGLEIVLEFFFRAFQAAIETALPVLAASFLATAAMAVLARLVPPMNLFTDALPLRSFAVTGALVLFLPFSFAAIRAALGLAVGPVAAAMFEREGF